MKYNYIWHGTSCCNFSPPGYFDPSIDYFTYYTKYLKSNTYTTHKIHKYINLPYFYFLNLLPVFLLSFFTLFKELHSWVSFVIFQVFPCVSVYIRTAIQLSLIHILQTDELAKDRVRVVLNSSSDIGTALALTQFHLIHLLFFCRCRRSFIGVSIFEKPSFSDGY